jgi:large subunit ribosomal protein L17
MRHRRAYRKFGLPSDQRKALLRGLTRSMLLHDRIQTTETRAKEVQPIVEKLVTIARKGGEEATTEMRLHTRRLVRRYVDSNLKEFARTTGEKNAKVRRNPHYAVPRLFEVIAPRYKNRGGGYTRITKVGFRRGDGAPMVLLEFVDSEQTSTATPGAGTEQLETRDTRRGIFGLRRRRKEQE